MNFEKGKAIIFEQARTPAIKKIRFAKADDESIVVRTKYSGISSGTEMAVYSGEACNDGVTFPCVPGYENVGEVIYVGKKAFNSIKGEAFEVGDRVMANECRFFPDYCAAWGGQCEYSIKNPVTSPCAMDRPAKIPAEVSYEEAVVAYLACVAKKGIDMVNIRSGETVLITGLGCVGLSALQLAKLKGAGKVIAADIRECRLKLPRKYTDYVLDISHPDSADLIREMNDGKLADVVIECSGNPAAVNPIADYVRAGGRVHLQGQYRQPIIITKYWRWNCSDLRISCSVATNGGIKEEILQLIAEGKFDAKSLYSKVYDIGRAVAAYEELEQNRYDLLKILFKWEQN